MGDPLLIFKSNTWGVPKNYKRGKFLLWELHLLPLSMSSAFLLSTTRLCSYISMKFYFSVDYDWHKNLTFECGDNTVIRVRLSIRIFYLIFFISERSSKEETGQMSMIVRDQWKEEDRLARYGGTPWLIPNSNHYLFPSQNRFHLFTSVGREVKKIATAEFESLKSSPSSCLHLGGELSNLAPSFTPINRKSSLPVGNAQTSVQETSKSSSFC